MNQRRSGEHGIGERGETGNLVLPINHLSAKSLWQCKKGHKLNIFEVKAIRGE